MNIPIVQPAALLVVCFLSLCISLAQICNTVPIPFGAYIFEYVNQVKCVGAFLDDIMIPHAPKQILTRRKPLVRQKMMSFNRF